MAFDPEQKWFDSAYIRERTGTEEAMLYCTSAGRVLLATQQMKSLLGFDPVGRNLNDLMDDSQVAQLVADGMEGRTTRMNVQMGDVAFDLESHMWDDGAGLEMVFVPKGAYDPDQRWNDARYSLRVAQEINRALTVPLTTVNMLYPTLQEEEHRQWMCMARQGLHRLMRLSRQLEDSAEAELGHLEPLYDDVELCGFLDDLLQQVKPICQKAKIVLTWSLPKEKLPCRADPDMLRRMINHLISNAIQAQPKGGAIEVHLKHGLREEAVFTIADRGRSQTQVPDINFRPEDPEKIILQSRMGIGLPLAQAYAEAHGGRLMLMCGDKTGLVAKVILPCNRQEPVNPLRQFHEDTGAGIDPVLVDLSTVADSSFYQVEPRTNKTIRF